MHAVWIPLVAGEIPKIECDATVKSLVCGPRTQQNERKYVCSPHFHWVEHGEQFNTGTHNLWKNSILTRFRRSWREIREVPCENCYYHGLNCNGEAECETCKSHDLLCIRVWCKHSMGHPGDVECPYMHEIEYSLKTTSEKVRLCVIKGTLKKKDAGNQRQSTRAPVSRTQVQNIQVPNTRVSNTQAPNTQMSNTWAPSGFTQACFPPPGIHVSTAGRRLF